MTHPLHSGEQEAMPLTRRRLWTERVLGGPHLPVALYLIYVGRRTLADPTHSPLIDASLAIWLTYAWAGALVLGGVLIFVGALTASTRLESTGHGFHFAGLAIYTVVAVAAGLFGSPLIAVLLTLGGVSALRLRQLSKEREAQQVAGQILNGGAY